MKNKFLKKILKKKGIVPVVLAVGTVLAVRNCMYPMYADDYAYSFKWDGKRRGNIQLEPGHKMERIKNLKDVAESQASHFMTWGGRNLAHGLDQLFLIRGKKAFNFANPAMLMLQLFLIGKLGTKDREKFDGSIFTWETIGYYLSVPHLAATSLWMTGSFNYLWMGVFQSLFILPYNGRIRNSDLKVPAPLMALLGFLAGWSNEAGAGAAILYGGLITALGKIKKQKNMSWMYVGLLSAIAGLSVLLIAPGNIKRIEITKLFEDPVEPDDPDRTPADKYYTLEMYKHHFKKGFLHTTVPQLPLLVPVLFYFSKWGHRSKESTCNILLLELSALAIPSALMFSPEFPYRAAYPITIYTLAASVEALTNLDTKLLSSKLVTGMKGLYYFAFLLSYGAAVVVDLYVCKHGKEIVKDIKETKDDEMAYIPIYKLPKLFTRIAGDRAMDTYGLCAEIDEDPDYPYNNLMAQYYGIKGVCLKNPEDWDNY